MVDPSAWWSRYRGHATLLALAFVLLAGARLLTADTLQGLEEITGLAPLEASAVPPTAVPDVEDALPSPAAPLPVLADASLRPVPNPRTFRGKPPQHQFKTYEVQRGETPSIIAARFGIKPETLLGGNPFLSDESNLLQTGATLTILPVDGILHTVGRGETLEGIAGRYDVPVTDIIAYAPNNLEFPYRLFPDTQLLIPGAAPRIFTWEPPSLPAGQQFAVVGTGTFVWPVTGRCMTSDYWFGHPAIDIALPIGSAVVAMDTGTVTYASWAAGGYYDYGNLIVINHGNGFETFYAHLSGINVFPGQIVTQGDFIGTTGNTGRSSGPHIHIEIRLNGAHDNPLWYLGGGVQDCTAR